jgi:hypothetical protein
MNKGISVSLFIALASANENAKTGSIKKPVKFKNIIILAFLGVHAICSSVNFYLS